MHNFDELINRKNSGCVKYDGIKKYFHVEDAQPLWVADSDFKVAKPIEEALVKRAMHGIFGYGFAQDKHYEAIQNWMQKRHDWRIQKEHITLTNGVVPAYSAAIEALSNKGDEVIVQTPVYFPLFKLIKENKRKVIYNPLKEKDGYYTMDLEHLKSIITPKTKILTLCSPHNPVGRVWSEEELEALALICLEHNITIISDEIHADIVYTQFTPLAKISEAISNNTLTLNSPGKTFNTAGLNCAYAIASNKRIKKAFDDVVRRRELHSINLFGYEALMAAYNESEEYLLQLLEYLKQNIELIYNYLDKTKIEVKKPESTYLLWLSFKNYTISHKEVRKKLLTESKVILNDGLSFGKEGEFYFRLNIALPRKELETALSKIVTVFS